MSEENILKILKDSKVLTSVPQVLVEIIRVTEDEDCGAKQIAGVILKDPALSVKVLRIVNSPFYSPSREISTISQAVVTMGTRSVKAMALSSSLYKFFDNENDIIDRTRFWRHSLEVAIACREIAQASGYKLTEEAFLAGLMHDIGILILESNFEDQFKRVWRLVESGESLVRLEESNWGTDHARVAKFLLNQWRLPDFIAAAIGSHHDGIDDPEMIPENRMGQIIMLANLISKFRICHLPPLNTNDIRKIELLSTSLNIGNTVLADLQEKVLTQLIKESKYLDIKIGSTTDLLKDSNKLIYRQYLLVESVLSENRKMQAEIARDQIKKAALESLKTITATLSHYINNASATILGRAQLVEIAVAKKTVKDDQSVAVDSMKIIIQSVDTISMVLEELKKLSSFDTTIYHDETKILDIEDRLKKQIADIEGRNKQVDSIS